MEEAARRYSSLRNKRMPENDFEWKNILYYCTGAAGGDIQVQGFCFLYENGHCDSGGQDRSDYCHTVPHSLEVQDEIDYEGTQAAIQEKIEPKAPCA